LRDDKAIKVGAEYLEKDERQDPETIAQGHSKITKWKLPIVHPVGTFPGYENVNPEGQLKDQGETGKKGDNG
jgi:hypothetical protein